MELQEGETPKLEPQEEKTIKDLVNAFEVFDEGREAWRKQLTFAASFPNHRLRQAEIYLNLVFEAGGEVFIIDETSKDSTGIIRLTTNEYSELYTSKLPKGPEAKPKLLIHYGPILLSLANLKRLNVYHTLRRKEIRQKTEDFKGGVNQLEKEGKKAHSIVLKVRQGLSLRKRIISDLANLDLPGRFWVVAKHQGEYHPVLGNAEGEWGFSKALLRKEL